jgi:hypothetical protein
MIMMHDTIDAAIFSYAGQMDVVIKNLFLEQIRLKLQLVDGEVNKSKVRAITKHCVRNISAAINRSASRNVETSYSRLPKFKHYMRLPKWSTWHAIPNKSSPLPLPATCDLTSSASSAVSPDDLLQEFELQIMNQDVVQI